MNPAVSDPRVRCWAGWTGLGLAVAYFLACVSLPPVDWELYVTEKIHLQMQGLRPFLDFEWPYGILPFLMYGLPMKWLGTALIWQRLVSVATAVAILVLAHCALRDAGVQRGRWVALALVALVSTSQQFSHSHPVSTLCALVLWRLLAREGTWDARAWSLACLGCVVAVANKPLFGGLGLAMVIPVAAWWLGRLRLAPALLLGLGTGAGVVFLGALVAEQPLWLANWYAPFAAGRTDAIFTSLQRSWLTLRKGYLLYFLQEGPTPAHIQFYLTWGFPLLVFDAILLASAIALLLGRLGRKAIAFLTMTAVVGAQALITGDLTLIGYAQEVLPLCFLLAAMVAHELEPGRTARAVRLALCVALLAFATHYASSLWFTRKDPMGSGGFRGVHILRQHLAWEAVGQRLATCRSAMSLGDVALLYPTYQQGIPNFGAVSEAFLLEDCFQRPSVERYVLEVLKKWRPEAVLVAEPSAQKAPRARSLEWIAAHYEEIFVPVDTPLRVRAYRLKERTP